MDWRTGQGFAAPRSTVMDGERQLYVRSYLLMRAVIGGLAFLLPVVAVFGDELVFDRGKRFMGSVSAYYYTGAREWFVGCLCVSGVFLITYKVFDHFLENRITTIAGVGALLVALFPTVRPDEIVPRPGLTPLQNLLGEKTTATIHFAGSLMLMIGIGIVCYFFGVGEMTRPPHPSRHSPTWWRNFHWACAGVIAAAMVLFGLSALFDVFPAYRLLVTEFVCAVAFGASWLAKGLELNVLLNREDGGQEPGPQLGAEAQHQP